MVSGPPNPERVATQSSRRHLKQDLHHDFTNLKVCSAHVLESLGRIRGRDNMVQPLSSAARELLGPMGSSFRLLSSPNDTPGGFRACGKKMDFLSEGREEYWQLLSHAVSGTGLTRMIVVADRCLPHIWVRPLRLEFANAEWLTTAQLVGESEADLVSR